MNQLNSGPPALNVCVRAPPSRRQCAAFGAAPGLLDATSNQLVYRKEKVCLELLADQGHIQKIRGGG